MRWYRRKAYMLLNLQKQNYTTWACKVRNVLYKSGFGVVWEMQGVGNVNLFIKEFRSRLIDCFKQDWHAALGSHDFYNVYSNFSQLIIMYIYHALINALSAHMIHINLNMIFYTHVKHSPTKTIYIKYYLKINK